MCIRKLPTQNTRAAGVQNPNGGFHKDFQLNFFFIFFEISSQKLLRSESAIRAALEFLPADVSMRGCVQDLF